MRIVMTGAGLAMLALAGCEEFDFVEPTDAESIFLDLQDENLAIRTELDALDVTPDTSLPLTGAATYDGSALIALDTPVRDSELIGHAALTADFETSAITGQLRGFYGTIDGGDVESIDGTLVVNGTIDASEVNQIGGDVEGTLTGADDTLTVDGGLTGDFLGDPASGEAPAGVALEATDDSVFTLNGVVVVGGMDVIGLDDPLP